MRSGVTHSARQATVAPSKNRAACAVPWRNHIPVAAALLPAAGWLAAGLGDPAIAADAVADGASIYSTQCIQCHSAGLVGGAGPALKGREFVAKWQGKKARQLYSRILMTMPANNPGSLSTSEVLALVSFIANENALAEIRPPFKSPDQLNDITLRGSR